MEAVYYAVRLGVKWKCNGIGPTIPTELLPSHVRASIFSMLHRIIVDAWKGGRGAVAAESATVKIGNG